MALTVTFITRAITMIIGAASVIAGTVTVIMRWETLGVTIIHVLAMLHHFHTKSPSLCHMIIFLTEIS